MAKFFDTSRIQVKPISVRVNKLHFSALAVDPDRFDVVLSPEAKEDVRRTAAEIRRAKKEGASVIFAFGAHSIKNGLSPVFTRLMERRWVTHFATNGAGIIHDWEFALQGASGEDVHRYVNEGQFGIWEETGKFLNLALIAGAYRGTGYGESVARFIASNGCPPGLYAEVHRTLLAGVAADADEAQLDRFAAACDLQIALDYISQHGGVTRIAHSFPDYSACCNAWRLEVPYTCHPMIGHDIIYTHPVCSGAAIGRCARRDFLSFVQSVSRLKHGVYVSVGSAVMSPMIFEKALSMARNVARQEDKKIDDFSIHVVDLAPSTWDWNASGEPPVDNPAYYLRFCKTFSRMGGRMSYCCADNRSWFVALLRELEQ